MHTLTLLHVVVNHVTNIKKKFHSHAEELTFLNFIHNTKSNRTGNVQIHLTWGHVRETIVAMEKQ